MGIARGGGYLAGVSNRHTGMAEGHGDRRRGSMTELFFVNPSCTKGGEAVGYTITEGARTVRQGNDIPPAIEIMPGRLAYLYISLRELVARCLDSSLR
jgi:hypothetical protein